MHHGAGLLRVTKDEALVEKIKADWRSADLPSADQAMLEYAEKLTRTPREVSRDDVQTLRDSGFSDAAFLDVCMVTAYFAFVNRIADGLGVELESYWHE